MGGGGDYIRSDLIFEKMEEINFGIFYDMLKYIPIS